MPICRFAPLALAAICLLTAPAFAVELPHHYFTVLETELKSLDATKPNPGAMFAAAVLYSKQHPANRSFGDKTKLDLALKLGDQLAEACSRDKAENKQDYEWEIHFWLDTYRLLEKDLGVDRRTRWKQEIETIVQWFAGHTAERADFPRYQGPYLHTSPNHYALFASTVYLAGRVLPNKDWEALGAKVMHRFAAEEQTADGFWGEFTDNGPATGYNYITMNCVALYGEHSKDKAALDALRRAADFHKHFTWPNGTPVETINGRNRTWGVTPWGHFGFTHWPDGRRYAEFLAGFFTGGSLGSKTTGRLAQSTLYYHEGPTEKIPQDLTNFDYRMKRPAGIRKTGPWTVCLSGLIDASIDTQFTLDRQGHMSIYHEKLGLIITGANSRNQPELATFLSKPKDRVTTIPINSQLRMSADRDRLGLAYPTFFAEAEIPTPTDEQIKFRFQITETSRNRANDVTQNLQLCLKAGETLETTKMKIVLDDKRIDLSPADIGGWIRHRGWTLHVDPASRLTWPILPFNPYKNGPETDIRLAIGVLTTPVQPQLPPPGALNWRRAEIAFRIEATPVAK